MPTKKSAKTEPNESAKKNTDEPKPVPNMGMPFVLEDIAGEVSEPSGAAPALATDEDVSALRDKDGNKFDPAIHETDESGAPVKTKAGLLRKRPGRKSSKQKTRPTLGRIGPEAEPGPVDPAADFTEKQTLHAQLSGRTASRMFVSLAAMVGGDEWQPRKERGFDEQKVLDQAFEDYCVAKGINDIPPGVALVAALATYAMPRLAMPTTQTKLQRFGLWLKTKFTRKRKRGAHVDIRNDRERKNDAGKTTGHRVPEKGDAGDRPRSAA